MKGRGEFGVTACSGAHGEVEHRSSPALSMQQCKVLIHIPFTAECSSSEVQVAVRGFGALSKGHYRLRFPADVNV